MMNLMRGAFRLAALVFSSLCGLSSALPAQVRVSNWQTYSALLNVRSTASDRAGNLWAATSGGVFSYNLQNRTAQEFRNINALYGIDITAIAVEPTSGTVYAGGFNGAVNIYDGKNWSLVADILTANIVRKQINGFLFSNDLVFIAGEFGLTIFDPRRRIFTETVQRFANLQAGSAVKKILIAQGRIWAATEKGVVSAPIGLRTYANPASWTVHPFNRDTLPCASLTESGGIVYAAQETNLWLMTSRSNTTRFDSLVQTFSNPIRGITTVQNQVFIGTDEALLNIARENLAGTSLTVNSLTTIDSAGQQRLAVNARQGFMLWRSAASQFISLNSPADNRFRSMTVDAKGRLWCVSGSNNPNAIPNDGVASGVSMLQDSVWRVFSRQSSPALPSNSYYQIDAQPNGTVWAASFGDGSVIIEPEMNFRLTTINTSGNVILPSDGTTFSVLGQVQTDTRTGTAWFTNYQTGTDQVIISRDTQGRVRGFSRSNLAEKRYHFNAIDRSGTKWLCTYRGTQMLAFNERGTPDNAGDDIWFNVPTTIINEGQNCIASDGEDKIWVGTSKAMYTIVNPGAILQTNGQSLIIDKPRKLLDQSYNAVAVDALNYKWFGTNNGVIVYDSIRDTILARFTVDNSPLASNTVLSIAIDNNSGKIYFGTDNGLSVATTLSIRPNTDFAAMRCYPQPFIPKQDNELVIDGLAEGTQVKITTIDGLLVRNFPSSNSRTLVWDGLDAQGQPVQSGVYLISAYSDNVGSNAVIKAMVIQRN